MTILEYLQDMELEDRVALVGCADNALRGLRNCTAKTAAASNLDTLSAELHCSADRLLHCSSE